MGLFLDPIRRCLPTYLMDTPNTDSDHLQRLLDALEKVRAVNGSQDIINSLLKAIEDIQAHKN